MHKHAPTRDGWHNIFILPVDICYCGVALRVGDWLENIVKALHIARGASLNAIATPCHRCISRLGAIFVEESSLTVEGQTTFHENHAKYYGGERDRTLGHSCGFILFFLPPIQS